MTDKTKYFFEVYGNLPRAGPGDNSLTRKAYQMIKELPAKPTILDIGCGPGIQTIELAEPSKGKLIGHFVLPDSAWLANFYDPMQQNINELKAKYSTNKVASEVLNAEQYNIELFKKYSEYFGYAFFIMQKS